LNNLLQAFQLSDTLKDLDKSQLQFLIDRGEVISFKKGDFLFEKDKPADFLIYVISGRFRIYLMQNNQKREVATLEPGNITGVLPYSRMTHATGFAQALEASEILQLHKDHFKEMIIDFHPLAEALVHHMATRIRDFTKMRMQDEKLISLGKLSAGLAHELNNPASAMVRSSEALSKHLKLLPDGFKRVMKSNLDPNVVDEVNDWLFDLLKEDSKQLTLMDRNKKEDELIDYLEELELENAFELAEELVEYGIEIDKVKELQDKIGNGDFETILTWVANNINTERMVEEINTSAQRIAELISSIKEYSHMDRSKDRQAVDVNHGIHSTLTMLKHKIKKSNIEVETDLSEVIPAVSGFPGELNQVWTNLIDNAIDAMSEKGGTLSIKTEWCEPLVAVEIGDTGSGIPEEIQGQIFDPFFTTKEVGKGTGLGLDIVSRIITRHRASIDLNSKPGKTTFRILLPATEEI